VSRKLPVSSTALTEATKHGVEIGTDGKVYGLMLIHHWCGNDPVRHHLARVDIASVLKFLQEGEWTGPIDEKSASFQCERKGGSFTKWGWNISEHYRFLSWESYAALQEAKRARKIE
jgi:hypothetical protein